MDINSTLDVLQDHKWIDDTSTEVQKVVGETVRSGGSAARKIKDFLNGVWLGHPVHPMMTDVAIGGYTTAWFLDLLSELADSDSLRTGADQAMAVGLLGSIVSAVTGLADWSDTDGKARNLGLLHALTNLTGTSIYLAAFLNRHTNRPLRFWLSMVGATVLTVGAYLGGHLVYEEQIGVDHAKGQPFPEKFTPVMPLAELPENTLVGKEVKGARILLVLQDGKVHAMSEVCTHLGGPLAEGKFNAEDCSVTCPWHGSTFAFEDGSVMNGPATHPEPSFITRIRNGQIEVKLEPHT